MLTNLNILTASQDVLSRQKVLTIRNKISQNVFKVTIHNVMQPMLQQMCISVYILYILCINYLILCLFMPCPCLQRHAAPLYLNCTLGIRGNYIIFNIYSDFQIYSIQSKFQKKAVNLKFNINLSVSFWSGVAPFSLCCTFALHVVLCWLSNVAPRSWKNAVLLSLCTVPLYLYTWLKWQ